MSRRERLEAVLAGRKPDRTPVLGGWIACPEHLARLAGVSLDDYWADQRGVSIRAYDRLGVDGIIDIYLALKRGDFRYVDADSYFHAESGLSLEEAIQEVDRSPSPESVEKDFDFDAEYEKLVTSQRIGQKEAGEMLWMPGGWGLGVWQTSWYQIYGYENFFLMAGLYPDRLRKLMEVGGALGRCRARVIARAVTEGLRPRAFLFGEDFCTQRGPMISPDFLEKYFAPELRRSLEPVLEVGCRPVWHCDGDVRLVLDMLIDCGVGGFQGFQPECGMTIEAMAKRRTRDGAHLLIFGPLSVTTELPVLSPAQIRRRVRHAVEICSGNADLVLFTSNTINPDVPLENILAMVEAVRE